MRAIRRAAGLLLLAAGAVGAAAGTVRGHEVLHTIVAADAVVLELTYGDGEPFAYETCEIYRAGEDVPFQVGHTDAVGRFAFVPDRPGSWIVKAFSEDGHGLDLTITAGDSVAVVGGARRSLADRFGRLVTGVSVLFGLFGLWTLTRRGRSRGRRTT